MRCERCKKETNCTIMSIFNTQTICMECKSKEEKHPEYKIARQAEMSALQNGCRNYPGIGLPVDLK